MKTILVGKLKQPIRVDDDFILPEKHMLSINYAGLVKVFRSTGKRRPSGTYIYESQYLHRVTVDAPKDKEVLFIDRDKTNLVKSNLMIVEHAVNTRTSGRKSGSYKGVHYNKLRGKWIAQITHNYKCFCLGSFDDEQHAASAYNEAAVRLHGEHAYVNIMPED